jgi:hypothetical protein
MSFWDIFKKKPAEPVTETAKEEKPKKPRKKKSGPQVKVLKFDFDASNPRLGSIELDWNDDFVELLKSHGYTGDSPEAIVDGWLTDVCKTIASSEEFASPDNVRYIQRRDLGGGKSEFS